LCAIDVLAMAHLAGAALATLAYLREMGASRFWSVCGGLFWMSCPFVLVFSRCWVFTSYTALFAPLCFWMTQRYLNRRGWKPLAALVAFKALFFFQGYVQFFFYLCLVDGAYFLLGVLTRRRDAFRRYVTEYSVAHAALPLLTAPLLIPMLEAVGQSADRFQGLPLIRILQGSLEPWDFMGAQFFYFDHVIFKQDARVYFLGFLGFLWLLGWLPGRTYRAWLPPAWLRWMGALPLFFSTVAYVLLAWMPPFHWFRWPLKMALFGFFFVVVYAVLFLDKWQKPANGTPFVGIAIAMTVIASHLVAVLHPGQGSLFSGSNIRQMPEYFASDIKEGRCMLAGVRENVRQEVEGLAFNYATLAGRYHFAGYNILYTRFQERACLGLNARASWNAPIPDELLDYWSQWSVKYLIASATEAEKEKLSMRSRLRELKRKGDLILYEIKEARPYAWFHESEETIRTDFTVNEMRLEWDPARSPRRVILNIAPLPHLMANFGDGIRVKLEDVRNDRFHLNVPADTTGAVIGPDWERWTPSWILFGAGMAWLAAFLLLYRFHSKNGEEPR
jgi:hypothetical protein